MILYLLVLPFDKKFAKNLTNYAVLSMIII